MKNSLHTRLQFGLSLSLMLLMALLWWAGSLAVRELGEDLIESRLEHDAEALLAAMDFKGQDNVEIEWQHINPIYQQPFSGHYYVVITPDGAEVSSRSIWDHKLQVSHLAKGETKQWYAKGPSAQQLLVWARHYDKQGQSFTLAVAEDISPLESHLSLFQWTFAGLALAALFILLAIQKQVITRSLQSLEHVRIEMQQLEKGDITTLSEDVPSELLPMVQEFNSLLVLLAQRLERSRNALGNLAHALKAPLNLLMQYLDTQELDEHPTLRNQTQVQAQRIQQLMERELKRARLAGASTPGQRFDPHNDLPALVTVLQQVHQQKGLNIQYKIDNETPNFADREDMLELLGNLLDNACKWAKQQVNCNISGSNTITILIEDDGPGRSEQELDQMMQRGVRLDETVDGHGLGLAITTDIVKLYGGDMRFDNSEQLGGLRVTVHLYQS
ncbi:sensor histidine kinase [Pseudomonadota bacterium]